MTSRFQNEKKFKKWKELENGGRIYILEVFGKNGWKAKYLKEVDIHENTVCFKQEIYNENNNLVEIHEKFPVDKGHKRL